MPEVVALTFVKSSFGAYGCGVGSSWCVNSMFAHNAFVESGLKKLHDMGVKKIFSGGLDLHVELTGETKFTNHQILRLLKETFELSDMVTESIDQILSQPEAPANSNRPHAGNH